MKVCLNTTTELLCNWHKHVESAQYKFVDAEYLRLGAVLYGLRIGEPEGRKYGQPS